MLDITQFQLEHIVFELRFDPTYLQWDRAGQLTAEIRRRDDQFKVVEANPAKIALQSGARLSLIFELEKVVVSAYPGGGDSQFRAAAELSVEMIDKILSVHEYSRIGYRQVHVRPFDSVDAASVELSQLGLLGSLRGSAFNLPPTPVKNLGYTIRREGEDHGVTLILDSFGETGTISPGPGQLWLMPNQIQKSRAGIRLDVDYYTLGIVRRSQFVASEWLAGIDRLLRRDIHKLWQ